MKTVTLKCDCCGRGRGTSKVRNDTGPSQYWLEVTVKETSYHGDDGHCDTEHIVHVCVACKTKFKKMLGLT